MPCHTRMKRIMQGLLWWLFLLEFGFLMVMSLEPGFLDFDNLPDTNFSCVGKVIGGYYADLETNCQMFHVCTIGQLDEPMDIRFLCLNGTVFDQETRVCERIDEVDCSKSEQFYSLNLELYGNTQPPILEEDFPVEIKRSSSTTTTTTTTTQRPSRPKPASQPYYTTSVPPTTTRTATKVITSHHFPVVNSPDIRFNPEEINISLNPGSPPDITRSQVPISFQQQSYNSEKNTRVSVTTHTTIYKNDRPQRVPLLPTANTPSQIYLEHENVDRPKIDEATQTAKSVLSYGLTYNQGLQAATPTEINYGFTYQQTEESVDYNTEVPPHPYQYQISIANLRPPTAQEHPYHSSYLTTSKRPHKINFPVPTTYRNHPAYTSVRTSSSQEFHSQRTEKPPRLQLPLPLLPTLPPLTFSSPAPFSLGRHIETKRFTNDHQSPPRIIISASASVSDNSGRRLNYSLGTIGASHLLGIGPSTYDEYKEDDVGLDPFYHDVPKIKSLRHKRSALREEDVIKSDQDAADLLRYLFNWYRKRENMTKISIPVTSEDITEINEELAPIVEASSSTEDDYLNLFEKANRENVTKPSIETMLEAASAKQEIQFETKNNTDNKLAELEKMLEILNKTNNITMNLENSEVIQKSEEEKKHLKVVEKMLETLNKTNNITINLKNSDVKPKSEEKKRHSEVVKISQVNDTTSLNKTDSQKRTEQNVLPNAKKKKPRNGRNNRRRTGKSRTTPRRTKKPKSHRKSNNVNSSNSTRVHDESHLNKSHKVDETHSKNAKKNASRSERPQKTNGAVETVVLPKPGPDILDDVNKDKQSVHGIHVKQSKNLDKDKSHKSTTITITEAASTEYVLDHTTLGNKSELLTEEVATSTVKDKNIKQKKLPKIYELLGEPETPNYLPQLDPKNLETDADEDVETHESKQLEHVIPAHEMLEYLQSENISTVSTTSENTTSENITFKNTTPENTNPESTDSITTSPKNINFANTESNNTTPENSTTEQAISENDKPKILKVEKDSTEVYENTKKQIQDDEVKVTTTSEPEYVSTTILSSYENLETQPSSYKNEEKLQEDEEYYEVQHNSHDHEVSSSVNKKNVKISENGVTDKLYSTSEYVDYENETEPPKNVESSTEYLKEENDRDTNLHRTEKTLEEQELEEATLHIDLLNSTNYPEINDEEEVTHLNFDELKEEEKSKVKQITENLGINTITLQPVLENDQQDKEKHFHSKNKNIALIPLHASKELLVFAQLHHLNHEDVKLKSLEKFDTEQKPEENKNQTKTSGRSDQEIANRRTYEAVSDEEEFPNGSKLSALSLYKSKAEGQKRRNNYIRNRKFIANSSPSKNTENVENTKTQQKENPENHDKPKLKEENLVNLEITTTHYKEDDEVISTTEETPIIPDYVDDNYEPLTYHEPSKANEFENLITTTYRDQDLEENTVTDKLEHLNSLEHSTDFSKVSDLLDHTSTRSNEDEEVQNTTIGDKGDSDYHQETSLNQEEKAVTTMLTQADDFIGTKEASYELLTEATTSIGSTEHATTETFLKYVEEQTTESSTTHLTTQTIEITTLPTTSEKVKIVYNFETTKEPVTMTTAPETTTNSPLLSEYVQTTNTNTESTIDLVEGPVFTTDYPSEETTMNFDTTQATSVAPSSTSDASTRVSSLTEPNVQVDLTTPMGDGTTNKYQHLKTRLPWYKRQDNAKRKEHARHRFSTNSRRIDIKGLRERTKLENKITRVLNNLNRSNSNSHRSANKLLVDKNRNINNNNNTAKLSDIESIVKSNTTNNNNSSTNNLELKHDLQKTKIQQPSPLKVTTVKSPEVTTEKSTEVTTTKYPGFTAVKAPESTTVNSSEVTTRKSPEVITAKSSGVTTVKSPESTTVKSAEVKTGKSPEITTLKSPGVTTVKPSEFTTVKSPEVTSAKSSGVTTVKAPESTTVKSAEVTTGKSPEITTAKSPRVTTVKPSESTTVKSADVTTVESPEFTTIESSEVTTVKSPEFTTVKSSESIETTIIPEKQQATTVPTELERSKSGEIKAETSVTDAPLLKSANPTKAKYTKIVFTTTPLSKLVRVELRKDIHGRRYSFNCFNKKIHQFYSDARDCRLFHYCTLGYTKNQMVDMKFVCDAGTYFDDKKLICTKVKPARCL